MKWPRALAIALRRPGVVAYRAGLYLGNRKLRWERLCWIERVTGAQPGEARGWCEEIERDRDFLDAVRGLYRSNTRYFPLPTDFMVSETGNSMFFHCVSLYAIVRIIRPKVIVETGGTPGKSSAFLLRALQRNGQGHLWTIDLAPPSAGCRRLTAGETHSYAPAGSGTGWAIPSGLKAAHSVVHGDARERLPALLKELNQIDVFLHDSDHSYEHMMWEFQTVYPYIRQGGLVLSDDIGGNDAWHDFCRARDLASCEFTSQGGARKPVDER